MDALIDLAKGIGIAGVFIAIFLLVLANVQTQIETQTSNISDAYNATDEAIEAVAQIPGWFAIVIIVGIAVVLFLLLRQMSRAGGTM